MASLPPVDMEVPVEEKRKDERFELCLSATVMVVSKNASEDGKILNLSTKDICLGGAFFHSSKLLPLGTEVRIQMILPLPKLKTINEKETLLRVEKGVVLRHEPNGMAIAFQNGRKVILSEPRTIH